MLEKGNMYYSSDLYIYMNIGITGKALKNTHVSVPDIVIIVYLV